MTDKPQDALDTAESGKKEPIRVLVAKAGLDGHDRGAKVVARALEDAGVQVFYTGLHQTPNQIVASAIENKVSGIGISVLSGAHSTVFPQVLDLLKEHGAADISVFGGGVIPSDDIPELLSAGVRIIFTPGTPLTSVASWVIDNLGH